MAISIQFPKEKTGAERRIFPRREVRGNVELRRLDTSIEARQNPKMELALRDLSLGGISALANAPLKPNERLSVFFPRMGTTNPWDAFGKVIRCEPSPMGYRVAVEFDPIPLAA